jgi:hypothetical protein
MVKIIVLYGYPDSFICKLIMLNLEFKMATFSNYYSSNSAFSDFIEDTLILDAKYDSEISFLKRNSEIIIINYKPEGNYNYVASTIEQLMIILDYIYKNYGILSNYIDRPYKNNLEVNCV